MRNYGVRQGSDTAPIGVGAHSALGDGHRVALEPITLPTAAEDIRHFEGNGHAVARRSGAIVEMIRRAEISDMKTLVGLRLILTGRSVYA